MSPDIRQTLERRGVDPAGEHARLQSARLAPSLRHVARKIEDGELAAAPPRPAGRRRPTRPTHEDARWPARAGRRGARRRPRAGFLLPATL
jgi:hypothetical protein